MTDWESKELLCRSMSGRLFSCAWLVGHTKRCLGTQAGGYLITGADWKGQVPRGMKQVPSPKNGVLVIGRMLVHSDSDRPPNLARQIQFVPLTTWQPSR